MTLKKSALFVTVLFMCTLCVAQKNRKNAIGQRPALLEAYTQRIVAGLRGGRINTETHFIIVWRAARHPEQFTWLADGDSINCSVAKAHKAAAAPNPRTNGTRDYYSERTTLSQIQKGDTLDIRPGAGGNNIHMDISQGHSGGKLLYLTNHAAHWESLAIDTIMKKKDIAMP